MKDGEIPTLVELIKKSPRIDSTEILEMIRHLKDSDALFILKCAIMAYDAVQTGLLVQRDTLTQ